MAKKIVQRCLNNIIVVCSTKGGEGKSMVSIQKLPLLFIDKNIFIFEVDNNNNSKKLKSIQKVKCKYGEAIHLPTFFLMTFYGNFIVLLLYNNSRSNISKQLFKISNYGK